MFAPLHGPNFYDFHWIPLAMFFHFWLYYAIANRKHWLTAAMVVVLFAIREDVAVGLAMLGLFLLFSGLRPRLGLVLAVVVGGLVRASCASSSCRWREPGTSRTCTTALFADGVATFGSVIKTIVTNPLYTFGTLGSEAKLTYVGHMFVPLALLPCRRVRLLPLAVAGHVLHHPDHRILAHHPDLVSVHHPLDPLSVPGPVLALMMMSRRAERPGRPARARWSPWRWPCWRTATTSAPCCSTRRSWADSAASSSRCRADERRRYRS